MRDLAAKFILGLSLSCLFSCAPKQVTQAYKTYTPLPAYADFVVFEPTDSVDLSAAEKLGDIILNKSIGRNCDYISLQDSAIHMARMWGANVLKINQHSPPTIGTCHRLEAVALKVSVLEPYLKNISWSQERRLQAKDFKADTVNRPFRAATASYISWRWETRAANTEVVLLVRSEFLCQMSYFKRGENSVWVLEHEQGHFDITEIYARKLRKAISEKSMYDLKTFESELRKLYETIAVELQNEQDKYDHDIYSDQSKQQDWLAKIKFDLEAYKNYNETKLVVKLKL